MHLKMHRLGFLNKIIFGILNYDEKYSEYIETYQRAHLPGNFNFFARRERWTMYESKNNKCTIQTNLWIIEASIDLYH